MAKQKAHWKHKSAGMQWNFQFETRPKTTMTVRTLSYVISNIFFSSSTERLCKCTVHAMELGLAIERDVCAAFSIYIKL